MSNLFSRKIELIIGNKKYLNSSFDIDFKVEFDDKSEPSISEISIFNLAENSRNQIKKNTSIILNAGYSDNTGTICSGEVVDFYLNTSGTDLEFKLLVGPSIDKWLNSILSKSYNPGIKASLIIRDSLVNFGLGIGDFSLGEDIIYPNGKVVKGLLKNIIDQIAKDTKSKFYIKNNLIYIRPEKKGTTTGFVLNSRTGLIGSPEKIIINDNEGYRVNMLLNHRINTDSIIKIESKIVNGNFRVVRGKHSSDFVTEAEVLPL